MPKRASDSSGEASARKMLHETLKRLRDRSGLSLEELHDETTYDRSYLHKLESGARLGSLEVMAALDKVYGTGDQLQQLWELARDDAFGSRYQRFMQLEREATVRYEYASSSIPGAAPDEGVRDRGAAALPTPGRGGAARRCRRPHEPSVRPRR